MSIHEGHRERMKNRFKNHGLENFDDHNVLELLLFYALPRKDVNPIAHRLMERFKTLDAVFDASIEELAQVPGVGENTAVYLKLVPQVSKRYRISGVSGDNIINSPALAGRLLVPYFMYEREEVVYMLSLDSKGSLLGCDKLCSGSVNATDVSLRRIAERALEKRAVSVIIAHNHPSGVALPSREDEATTYQIKTALDLIGIRLFDHIIVAGDDFVSMADSGLIR